MTITAKQADLAFQANLYTSANPTRRWLHNVRHNWILARIATLSVPAGGRALDVGVGSGGYTRAMRARGLEVVASDINDSFRAAAANIPGVRAILWDVCKPIHAPLYQVLHDTVDLAVCSEVIEHVEAPSMALQNIAGLMKVGGLLILTTPQRWSTTELTARLLNIPGVAQLARKIYREPVDKLGHISLMTATELRERIDVSGFEILEEDRFAFYLPMIAEWGGSRGQRILQHIEGFIRATGLGRSLLWTQAYVLRRVR